MAIDVDVPDVTCEVCGAKMNSDFELKHEQDCPNYGTGKTTQPVMQE